MPEPRMPKFRVLLVDNNPKVLWPWKSALQELGYDVTTCQTKDAAMRIVTSAALQEFDVAVIDQRLEDEDSATDDSGVRVAERIRGAIPALLMTGHPDKNLLVQASQSVAIMVKSDGPEGVHRIIQDIVIHRVFIVHGHDEGVRDDVLFLLEGFRAKPIVLADTTPDSRTIIEAIEKHSNVSFAIILVTPDDVGAKRMPLETLVPRARQNVIFEWGFFMGCLGRDRVAVLRPPAADPLELPSDNHGVRYIELDAAHTWRAKLSAHLKSVGIRATR
jgi:predicted nucleotide-binding protein